MPVFSLCLLGFELEWHPVAKHRRGRLSQYEVGSRCLPLTFFTVPLVSFSSFVTPSGICSTTASLSDRPPGSMSAEPTLDTVLFDDP